MMRPDFLEGLKAYVLAGGPIMIAIMALSLVMWSLASVKMIRFYLERRSESDAGHCLERYFEARAGGISESSGWQWDILSSYLRERCGEPDTDRDLLASLCAHQEARTACHIKTILVASAVAPLLGLLGTVGGMITTFDVISQFGTGNARALASGISTALITTQGGLATAVPGMLLGTLLLRQAEKAGARMRLFCLDLGRRVEECTEHGG